METLEELKRILLIFFDPMAVLFWTIVALVTVLILRKIYPRNEENQSA